MSRLRSCTVIQLGSCQCQASAATVIRFEQRQPWCGWELGNDWDQRLRCLLSLREVMKLVAGNSESSCRLGEQTKSSEVTQAFHLVPSKTGPVANWLISGGCENPLGQIQLENGDLLRGCCNVLLNKGFGLCASHVAIGTYFFGVSNIFQFK